MSEKNPEAWRLVRRAAEIPDEALHLADDRDALLRRASKLVGRTEQRRLWRKAQNVRA